MGSTPRLLKFESEGAEQISWSAFPCTQKPMNHFPITEEGGRGGSKGALGRAPFKVGGGPPPSPPPPPPVVLSFRGAKGAEENFWSKLIGAKGARENF